MLTDAHIHLFDLDAVSRGTAALPIDVMACASAHAIDEFLWQEAFARAREAASRESRTNDLHSNGSGPVGRVVLSFGVHPQLPDPEGLRVLETLASEGRIAAVGECGFDLFTGEFARRLDDQKRAWDAQLSIASDAGLPLVVHCRKALHLVFADTARLRRLKAVVFHGWPGSAREAESMLGRGVNAFFCAGKSLLSGDRSLVGTVRALPVGRILTETDAPYMKAFGEAWTDPASIAEIATRAAEISGTPTDAFESAAETSFRVVFGIRP